MSKSVVFAGILAALVAIPLEAVACLAISAIGSTGVFFRPLKVGDYATYLADRDPVLGWPSPKMFDTKSYDRHGCRPSPGFPDRDACPPAVAVYGDSFTYSDEVGDEHAWPEVLGRAIGRRVDNYGVGGYGSDQAVLRAEQNGENDSAPVVVLMHLTENIIRNVNQCRAAQYGVGDSGHIGLKPRFLIEETGNLAVVPLPTIRSADVGAFAGDPAAYLDHDAFVAPSHEAPLPVRFPFTVTLVRSLFHPRLQAAMARRPYHMHFYDPAHPARGMQTTARIMARFHEQARERGRTPLVFILPTGRDLEYQRRTGVWPHASLLAELAVLGVPAIDLGPQLAEAMSAEPMRNFYSGGNTGRHFNERGYELVARLVQEHVPTQR